MLMNDQSSSSHRGIRKRWARAIRVGVPCFFTAVSLHAEEVLTLDTIEVVANTPLHGVGLPPEKIPYPVQQVSSDDIDSALSSGVTDFMRQRLGSVTLNQAQNNPLQPDVQYRGFTASPLLGLPQGLAIYQNGARINDAFGDAVNWDLLPQSAIGSINLMGGANPIYGLNALGGALSVQMKNGFTHPGYRAQLMGGSFDRVEGFAEAGWNNGTLGAYVNVEFMDENGWREHSPTNALNLFSSFGWHVEGTAVDLDLSYADTDMTGNGAIPVQLLSEKRDAVFTFPDTTKNRLFALNLNAEHWIGKQIQLSGNLFYRDLSTDAFNGDAGDFEECESDSGDEVLCDEDGEILEDKAGNAIAAEDDAGNEWNAINNISSRDQETRGGSLQATLLPDIFGLPNQLVVGAGYFTGDVTFDADVEIARLLSNRGTVGAGIFEREGITRLDARTTSSSLYLMDSLSVTDALTLTLAGRYNETEIKNRDQSGERPDLNGDNRYSRFNPAAGLTFQAAPGLSLYANYSESARAPTPVELACSDPENECRLPNAFLADPPLKQVVSKSVELGVRGSFEGRMPLAYRAGYFHTRNRDDILFQAGGASGNLGFFDNIGDTLREGIELGLEGSIDRTRWFLSYTFLQATFEDRFYSHSPNHPLANADGNILVESGDALPGIPRNSLKLGLEQQFNEALSLGVVMNYQSGQYYRGDESNDLPKIAGFTTLDLHGEYRFNKRFSLLAKVTNLLDAEYSTFGLLGEPDEVLGDAYDDPRFEGPGAPRAGWIGIRVTL